MTRREKKQENIQMGKRIKAMRKTLELSQDDVAKVLGVTPITVSRWETGTQAPDDATKRRLANVLKTTVAYLFGEAPQTSSHSEPEVIMNTTAHSTTEMEVTGSVKRQFNETPLVVGEEPVWIDIVEPMACAGSGNGYHEVTWKPVGRYPFFPADLLGYAWHSGKLLIIRIEGSSMEPRYRDGDRVLFSNGEEASSGDVVIVMWDGRLFIRGYVVERDQMIHLKALNRENPEIVVHPEDQRLQVLGKVLAKVPNIEPDRGFW